MQLYRYIYTIYRPYTYRVILLLTPCACCSEALTKLPRILHKCKPASPINQSIDRSYIYIYTPYNHTVSSQANLVSLSRLSLFLFSNPNLIGSRENALNSLTNLWNKPYKKSCRFWNRFCKARYYFYIDRESWRVVGRETREHYIHKA